MLTPDLHTNSYISATVHHTNSYITLGLPVIPPNEEGLSPNRLDYQRMFDTFKTLLNLVC